MLCNIKNASRVRKREHLITSSKMKRAILEQLKQHSLISGFEEEGKRFLKVYLAYSNKGQPRINGAKKESRRSDVYTSLE